MAGYFRDLRPYVNHAGFPNCTHTHEADCAVKDAVADGRLDLRRYESYCHLFAGEMASDRRTQGRVAGRSVLYSLGPAGRPIAQLPRRVQCNDWRESLAAARLPRSKRWWPTASKR